VVTTQNVQGCSSNNNGRITISNATGGSGSYQYAINGGGYQANPVFENLGIGSYTVTIRDAENGGCSRVLGIYNIFGPQTLQANIALQQITCNGGTGILTFTNPRGGSGQYRFSIDGGSTWYTTPNFIVRAGSYDLRMQDLNFLNCVELINPNYQVTEPARLNASIVIQNVTGCFGNSNGSITITNQSGGSGAYEYSYNGGLTWLSNPIQANVRAGIYNVQIRDAQDINCVRILNNNTVVTEPAAITAQYEKIDLVCYGASNGQIRFTNQQGGSGNYEYSINGGITWQNNATFINLPGGIYNLRIREFGNPQCVSIVANSVDLREPAQLNATVTTTPVEGCNQNNNGTMTFSNYQGGSGAYEFSVDGGSWFIGPTVTGLAAGIYNVRIRDAVNTTCIRNLGSFTIFGAESLTADIQIVSPTCYGGSGILSIVNPRGGSGQYRYSIDGGNTWYINNVFSVTAGLYNVRIQDRNFQNCVGIINNNYAVDEPAQLNAIIDATPIQGCNGNQNGVITFSAPTGGSGAYEYSFDGGNTWTTNPTRTLLPAGIYDLRIRDRNQINCQRVLNGSFNLTQPGVITASYQKFDMTCFQANNGRIQFTNPRGGSGNYEYSIDGGNNWNVNSNFTGLLAGQYNLRIREFQNPNCETIVNPNVSITQPGELNAEVNIEHVQGCDLLTNGSMTFTNVRGGSGSYQFSVNGGNWFIGPTIDNLGVGIYNVRIRDAANPTCEKVLGTYTVFGPEPIQAQITEIPITCHGASTTLSIINPTGGSGEYEYTVDGGASWFLNNSFNVRAGIYNVRIRDRRYRTCVTTINGSYLVQQPQQMNAVVVANPVTGCNGRVNGSINISNPTGGSGLYRYSIDMGNNWYSNGTFTGLRAGTYTVMIQDQNNPFCVRTITNTLQITEPDPISASVFATNVIGCFGNTNASIQFLSPQGGSGLYRFSIDGGQNWQGSPNFTNLPAGNYSLWIGDQLSLSCTTLVNPNLVITQPSQLNASVNAVNISCAGLTDGRIEFNNPTGGSGQFQYSIDGGATWHNGRIFNNLLPGDYQALIRDLNNPLCNRILNTNIVLTAPAQLNASVSKTDVLECFGAATGSINFTNVTGGSGNYEYSVDGGQTWVGVANVANLGAGNYNAQIRDAVFPTCTRVINASITITQPSQINGTVASTNVSGCSGNTNGSIIFSNLTGGSGQYQYSVDGGVTWSNNPAFTNLGGGTYDPRVRDANFPNCIRVIGNNQIVISAPAPLTAVVQSVTQPSCNNAPNGQIILAVSGGTPNYTFAWSNGATTQNLNDVRPGTYTVTVTDNAGCTSVTSQTLTAQQNGQGPDVVAVWDNEACGFNNGRITASAVIQGRVPIPVYEYSLNGINWQQNNVFENLAPGTYTVRARVVGELCIGTYTLTLTTNGGPSGVTVTNITQTSVRVTWNAVNNNVGVRYNLRYRVQGSNTWTTITGIATNSRDIINLQPGTTYDVQVATTCPNGSTTNFSNTVNFTTQGTGGTCPTPAGIFVTTNSPTSATVRWSPVNGAVCYIVSFGRVGTNQSLWPVFTVTHPATSYIMTGLNQAFQYQVIVRTNCTNCTANSGTRSPWSVPIQFSTSNPREENPVAIVADEASNPIQNYIIYPNPNNGNFNITFDAKEAGSTNVVLTDITGKVIFEQSFHANEGLNELPIQLPDVTAGVYMLRFTMGEKYQTTTKIVIN
jgi:hypothetical protein